MGRLDLRFDTYGIATQIFIIIIIINIADEARGQYEANPVLWLATREGKMSPSCQYPAILTLRLVNIYQTKP